MTAFDWRLPENRREAFQRFYSFHLKYLSHPGCVYALLPAIADDFAMDEDQRAWLVWLNGNTQNVVTSLLILEAAPGPEKWERAVDFWNDHFTDLEWDTDRRHQKSRFGEATEKWIRGPWGSAPEAGWKLAGERGWKDTWNYAIGQPYMGRLSAWSMTEYARILLGSFWIPDADDLMLDDVSGSRSHRNGLAVIAGHDAAFWDGAEPFKRGLVPELRELGEDLLREAKSRDSLHDHEFYSDISRLTLESALCTYKSWHKPNRRYPNVYTDMMYNRIKRAEARFGLRFGVLWDARRRHLPEYLRLEDQPYDPGLSPVKQNHYLQTGEIPLLYREWGDMEPSDFDRAVAEKRWGKRKDPKWS